MKLTFQSCMISSSSRFHQWENYYQRYYFLDQNQTSVCRFLALRYLQEYRKFSTFTPWASPDLDLCDVTNFTNVQLLHY